MSDLQRAIAAVRSGDKATGKRLLVQVLKEEPRNQAAWLWMSAVVETDNERRHCLERVLAINPNNETARQGLEALRQKQTRHPPTQVQPKSPPSGALQTLRRLNQPITRQDAPFEPAKPSHSPEHIPPPKTQRNLLDEETRRLTQKGWQVVNRTEAAIQVRRPKQWSQIGLVLFVLLPAVGGCFFAPLFGVALVGLLFVLLDYLLKKERLEYITIEQLEQREARKRGKSKPVAMQKETPPKEASGLLQTNRATLALLALGMVTFFVLVIAFAFVYSLLGNTQSPEQASATIAPTLTLPPAPTPTPLPTSTPPSQFNEEEQQYLTQMALIANLYQQDFETMSELATEISEDPTLVFDAGWQTDWFLTTQAIKDNGRGIYNLEPPPRLVGVQQDMETAATYYGQAADLLIEFLDDYDIDKLDRAIDLMEAGDAAIQSATRRIEMLGEGTNI